MEIKLIHEDQRGKLIAIIIDGKEYLIIKTNEGYARGGDIHKSTQYDVVLEGEILWEENWHGYNTEQLMIKGDMNTVEEGIPHMYTSLTDSIVLEWLEGDFEKKYYKPFRKRIKEIIECKEKES